MKLRYLLLLPCLACAAPAHAAIYKRVDADGNVTYSNTPMKGSRRLDLTPLPTVRAENEGHVDYERVRHATQRNRDQARRRILEDELANEEQLLGEAREKLMEAQARPHVTQVGGQPYPGFTGQDGVQSAQAQVDLHQRNIKALKQELSSIK
jgi:Domain of unknown function (DUF4124)